MQAGDTVVEIATPLGGIAVRVETARAPVSSACFLAHVRGGHLEGTGFFRILTKANQATFPVQPETIQWGWRPRQAGDVQPLPPIGHEPTTATGLRHRRGSMSMARRNGVIMGCEYFICMGDEPELDFGGRRNPDGLGFAVFAQVIEGFDTMERIHARGEAEEYVREPVPVLSVRER